MDTTNHQGSPKMRIYNTDGLVDHRGPRPKKTPATILEEALERTDVRAAVAVWFGLPEVASIGEVVKTAIDRDMLREATSYARKLAAAPTAAFPAFVATCAAFALWASGQVPHVPSEGQARGFRHLAHQTMAAGPDEPSPIRLKPTASELRHRETARKWGWTK